MPEVYGSVELLLKAFAGGGRAERAPFAKNADSLSGSSFERVIVRGVPYVLKHLARDQDWVMRATGDGLHGPARVVAMWRDGLLDALPAVIDHAVVGASYEEATGGNAILLRDVGAALVPSGTDRIDLAQHRRFLTHMAALHAAFWDLPDGYGLATPADAYAAFSPAMAAREAAAGYDDAVPRLVPAGWAALRAADPAAYEVTLALATDPAPLVRAFDGTPATLIHRDWKYGNLGSHPDGRSVLLDWAFPGRGAPCADLGWYLAVNCDRLPESKEDTIAAYRTALERAGAATAGWWDRQLELALVGAFAQLGWSKTGDPAELGWWTSRIVPVARELLR
jgi:hypothetical protein